MHVCDTFYRRNFGDNEYFVKVTKCYTITMVMPGITRSMVKFVARTSCNLDCQDNDLLTPLHIAALHDQVGGEGWRGVERGEEGLRRVEKGGEGWRRVEKVGEG